MAQITEDYVSFEVAKLLKEKGFDEVTFHDYDEKGRRWFEEVSVNHNSQGGVACPTLQMAMKWLREIYKLEVRSTYDYDKDIWCGYISPMYEETDENSDIYQKALRFDYPGKSYEEACEAAIKHCLENLV